MISPWWYRYRSGVFAGIYALGFQGWIFAPALAYTPSFVDFGALISGISARVLLALALLLISMCAALRIWGSSYLSAETVWNADARTDALIVSGPFRYTRNPLYLGNALLAVGFALLAPAIGAVFITIANGVFIAMLVRHEEGMMFERYGAQFSAYCAKVPALWPRLMPAGSTDARAASLSQGLCAEVFSLALLAGAVAWVLAPLYGAYLFAAFYIGGIFVQRAMVRRLSARR